jgi:hypothetical protein
MITFDHGEKIKYVAKRHNAAFMLEVVFLIIAAIFPYFASLKGLTDWLINLFNPNLGNHFFLLLALYCLWLLFIWILFFIAWSDYYLDVWIITDGRVIDIEQTGVFRRKINSYRLDKITNVAVIPREYLGKIFNYGDVVVNLNTELKKFVISEVPEPEKIKQIILDEQRAVLERLQKTIQFEAGK